MRDGRDVGFKRSHILKGIKEMEKLLSDANRELYIFDGINNERFRQLSLAHGGDTNEFDKQNTQNDWVAYITAYAGRAAENVARNYGEKGFRRNMIKVAALAVAAISAYDKGWCADPGSETKDRNDDLRTELEFYEQNRAKFVERYLDKFVLIKGQTLHGSFDNFAAAYSAGLNKFGNVPMFIRQVAVSDPPIFIG